MGLVPRDRGLSLGELRSHEGQNRFHHLAMRILDAWKIAGDTVWCGLDMG